MKKLWARIRSRIGAFLYYFVGAHTEQKHLERAYHVWLARSPIDRLAEWEIERYSNDLIHSKGSPALAAGVPGSMQGTSAPLLDYVLKDPSVRSVLNVGVYVGNLDHYMASRYPNVQFFGADFWKDLYEANEALLLPNFNVIRGYPLDLIESGKVVADVIHFGSTATRLKEEELRRYIRASNSKYVVLNEPLFPLPNGLVPNPEELVRSIPMLVYPVHSGDKDGGYPPCMCHNYRKVLAELYDVVRYDVVREPTPRVFVVAVKRGASKG